MKTWFSKWVRWRLAVLLVLGLLLTPANGSAQSLTEKDAIALFQRADRHREAGENAEAERLYRRVLAEAPRLWGENSSNHAAVLNNLAMLYDEMGRYEQAEPLYRRSMEIDEAKLGKDHPNVANSLNNLAELYRATGRYEQAEPLYRRSLEIYEAKLGKDHPLVAQSLNNLALLLGVTGHYAQAEPLYRRSLEIRESKLGKDHPSVADSLNNLAILYRDTGRYEQAEPLYRRSMEIYQTKLGKDHPRVADSINNLALMYSDMGCYEQAEPLCRRSLEIYEAKLGKDHHSVANPLNNLANLYRAMGRYERAEPLYRRSLEINQAKLGKDHPRVADSLNNLAELHRNLGRYEQAEPLLRRSLAIREAKLGKDHPLVATSLNNLAALYDDMGRYGKTESLYRHSLEIYEAKLGKDHPNVAQSLNNLAVLFWKTGRYEQAEPLLRRSLAIREAKLGKDHSDVANPLNNLALLYWDMGRSEQAESLFRRSLAIREAKLGKDHPDMAASLNNLAALYAVQDKPNAAADHFDQNRRIIRRHSGLTLPLLSEREQLDFLQHKDRAGLHGALSLAYRHAADAGLAARSAAWLLNAKGVAQQTRASTLLAARDGGDPASGDALRELLDVRRQLARLTLNPPTAAREEAHRQRQQQLSQREQELVKQLQRQGAAVEDVDPWIELPKLRASLPENAVFIDLARFEVYNFRATGRQKRWGPARYTAWVTPREGPVQVIDLGEADRIDAAVAKARRALDEAPRRLKADGEIEAEKAARQALADLATLVFQPLRRHIDGAQRWVISPDGNLWLAPWAALPLDDKTYAAEKHTLQLVVSGRDLVIAPARGGAATPPAVFADPDFDRAPVGASRLAGKSCPGRIGSWPMTFVFAADGTVRIYDAEGERALAGQGSWELAGDDITIRTKVSRFTGRLEGGRASGGREKRNEDDSVTRDRWEFRLPQEEAPEPSQTRGLAELKLGKVPRLPGTAAEAAVVAEGLHKLFEVAPLLRTEDKATTAAFLALRRPRALVLATHGFFLPDQELDPEEKERLARDPEAKLRQRIEDPLLRCGLLLAGCNEPSGGDTGVLTGREVLSADLRGCELVVLSACETGLGDVRVGEGVAGLRQAFQLAGASSVLASLWKVPDDETALLMAALVDGLGSGRDRAAALAEAQRRRIAARREKFGAAHPYFWAAFSLTGDVGKSQR
jgi:tetratricopeptide (TPR) repeat protein